MRCARFAVVALLLTAVRGQEVAPANPFKPFDKDAFTAAMREAGANAEQLTRFTALCTEESDAAAAEWLLRAVAPDYAAAMKLVDDTDPRGALEVAALLGKTKDAFVLAHGRYQLGRLFLDADNPEGAAEVFADYLKQSRNRTPFDADAVFFYGTALARIPERQAAAGVLEEFLQLFPEAPERYRASAAQLVAELTGKINPLHEIADKMKGVERRLRQPDPGEDTQKRQEDVITELQKIIEQIEEQEKQSSGGGGSNPSSPRADSNLTPGATQVGDLRKAGTVTDRWGMLKDRDRKAIESEAGTKLSGRYSKLVEDYYRKLSKGKSQ